MYSATTVHVFQTLPLCAMALAGWLGVGQPACAQSRVDARIKAISATGPARRLPVIALADGQNVAHAHDERAFDFSPALVKPRTPAPPSINGSLGGDMKFTLRLRGHGLSLGVHSEF